MVFFGCSNDEIWGRKNWYFLIIGTFTKIELVKSANWNFPQLFLTSF